jgi:hypothetical protein
MNYVEMAAEIAKEYGVDPRIFVRQIQRESNFDPDAVSPAGAKGIAQIMNKTAAKPGYGVQAISDADRSDPEKSLRFGAQYMRAMLDKYDGDYAKALAAYNAGPGQVPEEGKIPFIEETYQYVGSILDPESAVANFNVGEYPLGVTQRPDIESMSDYLDQLDQEELDREAAFQSLVRSYQQMADSRMAAPEFIEEEPKRERTNPLRWLGIGSIFDGE